MLDLAEELNEAQLAAARHVHGPLLVLAGAGSGKTRVITYRIASLVLDHRVAPWRILAVTFTNKAAKEMRERVVRLLGEQAGQAVWISTFHASCAKLLRQYGERFGVDPAFTIYDDGDQKAMVARCLKDLQLDEKRFPPRPIQNEINRSKQELHGCGEYATGDFYREQVKRVFELYEKRMTESKALDFGDLIYRVVRGLRADEALAREIGGRFEHLLVDEFQDTNLGQLELVRRLASPHGNVCVVGDDDQSIYSWRGAEVSNILEFERHFPGAGVVTLDRNYRSTSRILAAAHGVVEKLAGRRDKRLWTKNAEGAPVRLIEAEDERDEARQVARRIKELKDAGVPFAEQAVFYRINAQSRVFEEVLRTFSIPYRVVGGMRFYERAEVKDVLAFLRVVQNPADLAALTRIINVPPRGIGKTTVDRLTAVAAATGASVYDVLAAPPPEELGTAAQKKLAEFHALVEGWRALGAEVAPSLLAERVLVDTGYVRGLEQENSAEGDARLENLKELVGSMQDFEREAETPTLASFLELVALQSDIDQAKFDDDQVTLMTVHAAKGLEFDAVFVTGLEEGLFPYKRAGDRGFDLDPEALAEERRLGYVAMTRARKELFLVWARTRQLFGQSRYDPRSRFVEDVPPGICEESRARPAVQVSALDFSQYKPERFYDNEPRRPWENARRPSSAAQPAPRAPSARPVAMPRAAQGGVKLPSFDRPLTPPKAPDEVWVDRSDSQLVSSPTLAVGQQARHVRFGIGRIVNVFPGAKIKVEVDFPGYGRKTILADFLEMD